MSASSKSTKRQYALGTRAVHLGRDLKMQFGFENMPAFRGSTVLYDNMEDLLARKSRFRYGSKGTPTTEALEGAWCDLTGAAGTVLVPSGQAACALALMSCLVAGDHVLVPDNVYVPTRKFCDEVLTRYGVEVSFYDPLVGSGIAALMKSHTKAVYAEVPGSQTFEVSDIPALATAAHDRGAILLMDNTWATPFFFPAHKHGVDLAIESGTKYLGGHSDLLLGLVSATEAYYPALRKTFDAFAMSAGPDDVFLALRGLRTMRLRLAAQQAAASKISRWLEMRPEVNRVLYPALPSCQGHDIWKRDFLGAAGLFSIILNPIPQRAVSAMLNGMQLFGLGFSWGGTESLIVPFDPNATRTVTKFEASGPCLRLQIGLEEIDDLIADLTAGFERLAGAVK